MSKLRTGIFTAACFSLLLGCKPAAEQAVTSEKYQNALAALKAQVETSEVDPSKAAARRFAAACGRHTLVQSTTSAPACAQLEALRPLDPSVTVPAAAVPGERAVWDTYADEPDRTLLAAVLSQNVEASRRALVASLIARHWRSSKAVGDKAKIFDAAVAAGMGDAFVKRAPAQFALTALDPKAREEFARRLEWEQKLLQAVGNPAADPLYEQTLADISNWRKRIESAKAFAGDVEALKAEIITSAENKAWDSAVANVAATSVPDGLKQVEASATARASKSPFDDFLTRAAALDLLRNQIAGARGAAPPPPLSIEAARQLVKDCRALMELDRSAGDEICGAASHALKFALDLVERPATDDRAGGNDSGTGPSTGPLDGPPQGLSVDLRARLESGRPAPGAAAADKAIPAADIQSVHVEALKARIGAISRSYAQASIHGYAEQVARLDAHLAYIHEAMRLAFGDTLPERLRNPLALLAQPDAEAALQEARRLQRIVARNLTLVPGATELEITAGALRERTNALESRLAAPPTKADLAAVVRKIDPDKAKALAAEMPPKVADLAAGNVKSWSEKFAALPARFDTWRGPRGPPEGDPKFPRSQRVLVAVELLGRNPTDAIRAFSALKAEHAEFYRELGAANGSIPPQWEFGRNKVQAWMAGLLAPADLAVAAAAAKQTGARAPANAVAEGWIELIDAAAQLQNSINVEVKMRRETAGRHPPGYPPKNMSTAVRIAERYAQEWDKRAATPIERQVRFQTANLMYPDPTTMPSALRDEVGRLVNDVLDTEMKRLDALLATLYGSKDQDGLLDRAARSVEKLPDAEMAALIAGKQKAVRAAEIIAQRVAAAESTRYVQVDPKRWDRIVWWFGGFGRGPPPEASLERVPPPPPLPGSGGAHFLFSSTELERNFVELTATLDDAERNLKEAESIAKRAVEPKSVGKGLGRAVADRRNWSDGRYSFDKILVEPKNRYPGRQLDWNGFWQVDEKTKRKTPFDFDRYVKNFTNFRGVGGGIHFGEVAAPDQATSAAVAKGAALSYDDTNKILTLRLHSGQTYLYGPVEPRVLKALYAYVTSKPGVNLAVTIGAAGAAGHAGDENGFAVLLDPHFADTRVGQDLYLADTIPWSLDRPLLPNGESNVAHDNFRRANDAYKQSKNETTDRILALLGSVKPLDDLTTADLRAMLQNDPAEIFLFAVASAKKPADFKRAYEEAVLKQELAKLPSEVEEVMRAVRDQASDLKKAGFSSKDVARAVSIVSGRPDPNRPMGMPDFEELLSGTDQAARLAKVLKRNGIEGERLRVFELAAVLLAPGGEVTSRAMVLADLQKAARKAAHEESERLLAQEAVSLLLTEKDYAGRVLLATRSAMSLDIENKELRASKAVMRLASSALLQFQKKKEKDANMKDVAAALPANLYDSRGLAVLFDDKVSFRLADERIVLTTKMRYRYATSAINVTSDGLTFELDGPEGKDGIKAQQIDGLAAAANGHIDEIVRAYPPLARVHDYAALAAFLRWAACARSVGESCHPRDGLTIDFSALGRYDLRDRKATPTPDMDLFRGD
jgi:hypothetical protein